MDISNSIADFQFLGSKIVRINMDNSYLFFDYENDTRKSVNVTYNILQIETEAGEGKDGIPEMTGIVRLNSDIKVKDDINHIFINILLEGGFCLSNSTDEEHFRDMLSINGCAMLYSITRSIVMSITSQTFSGGSIVLPMINVFKLSDELKQEDKLDEDK